MSIFVFLLSNIQFMVNGGEKQMINLNETKHNTFSHHKAIMLKLLTCLFTHQPIILLAATAFYVVILLCFPVLHEMFFFFFVQMMLTTHCSHRLTDESHKFYFSDSNQFQFVIFSFIEFLQFFFFFFFALISIEWEKWLFSR